MNVVEDRRIDNFIYTSAPGYRPYYDAMYNKYFNSKAIDKGLKSTEYRTEDWESYMFRLINITNKNRDLDALPGLKDVWNVLDLKNISRLKTTLAALSVALEIFEIVESHIPIEDQKDKSCNSCENGDGDESDERMGSEGSGEETKTPEGEADDDEHVEEQEDLEGSSEAGVEPAEDHQPGGGGQEDEH